MPPRIPTSGVFVVARHRADKIDHPAAAVNVDRVGVLLASHYPVAASCRLFATRPSPQKTLIVPRRVSADTSINPSTTGKPTIAKRPPRDRCAGRRKDNDL